MARANLSIDQNIYETFISAQEKSSQIRCLKINIAEEKLVLGGVIEKIGDLSTDFNNLREILDDNEASLLIFSLGSSEDSSEALKWILIAWVPDTCKVREKMLYSSSREDIKRFLGFGYFTEEYAANHKNDLSWETFQEYANKSQNHIFLSASERLIAEERVQSHGEATTLKSNAMGAMPFEINPEVVTKLSSFKNSELNWIEFELEKEIIKAVAELTTVELEKIPSYLNPEEARFILLRLKSEKTDSVHTIFIFFCPENIPVRAKMTMSSSKASVIALINSNGIEFDKTFEIRAVEDIVDLLRSEIEPDVAAPLVDLSITKKPSRPGRGSVSSRVKKFSLDEDP